jgi:hypothetical protein
MGDNYFLGKAEPVAQISTATPANVEVDDIFALFVNGQTIAAFTATAATVANVVAGLVAAWNASTNPYATGITASDVGTTHVQLLADVAGLPFTVTSAAVDGGGVDDQTLTIATPTASAGPNHWGSVDNWSLGAIPVNGDDVIIANTTTDICWDLDQNAVALDSLTIRKSFTGLLGLNWSEFSQTADGHTTTTTAKTEYRTTPYLRISATVLDIGVDDGPSTADGSARIKIDNTKAAASTTVIHSMATTSADDGLPACRLLFAHANANVYVRAASAGVGIAVDTPFETSTVGQVCVTSPGNSTASRVSTGRGVTITTWKQSGGTCLLQAVDGGTVTTVTLDRSGTLTTNGDFTITTLNNGGQEADDTIVPGGTINVNNIPAAGSAVTTANLYKGVTSALGSGQTRTWDSVNQYTGGVLYYDENVLTITNLRKGLT